MVTINDEYICSNCGTGVSAFYVDSKTGYVQVECGWFIDFTGGYAEFCDYAPEQKYVLLCHDCSLAVARALPGVFKPGSGTHAQPDGHGLESCCEFGWSIDGSGCVVVGDGNGGWIKKYDPDGKLIE